VQLVLPPLRERQEDIVLLANHFIQEICRENKKSLMTLSPRALTLLQNYSWPGNVRELRNVIEAAIVLSKGHEITPRIISERVRQDSTPPNTIKLRVGVTLRDAERSLIQATLAEAGGNRAKAARILGIGRKTLYRKLEEYGLK
jgi:DNA-binding NtrC family response regulator